MDFTGKCQSKHPHINVSQLTFTKTGFTTRLGVYTNRLALADFFIISESLKERSAQLVNPTAANWTHTTHEKTHKSKMKQQEEEIKTNKLGCKLGSCLAYVPSSVPQNKTKKMYCSWLTRSVCKDFVNLTCARNTGGRDLCPSADTTGRTSTVQSLLGISKIVRQAWIVSRVSVQSYKQIQKGKVKLKIQGNRFKFGTKRRKKNSKHEELRRGT